ncbi:MAG: DpnI domain-containing protein [Eubacteriales bacterium]|nr:DpnI domain-containing protein [Eubacteriales bacterium]MDD4422947.1 DpnI domain-containing protein [Eubacteriales bacterium]
MNLDFDSSLGTSYHSGTQIARILTEAWVESNMFCPRCGGQSIEHYPNNRPVADFYCPRCKSEFELKSKQGNLGKKINDGAYDTMIQRITSNQNPDFFFMRYSKEKLRVTNFLLIPKHFFLPDIVEKRKPLSDTARRAGWIGCNILIDKIPKQGRIEIISNGIIRNRDEVVNKVNRSNALATNDINARGWLLDVLYFVNQLRGELFSLSDMYSFSEQLYIKHPQNHNIKPKIRQQLQMLRDRGFIEFLGNGQYRKITGDD